MPTPPPIVMPDIINIPSKIFVVAEIVKVVNTAIAIPEIPKILPSRADSGFDKPLSARIKQTPETKYKNATIFADKLLNLLFIHR